MSQFKPYPAYKDSGVEWLGEVPEHWESWKVAHAFGELGSGTTPPTSEAQWYEDGTVPWVTTGELRENVIFETKKLLSYSALSTFSALRLHPAGSLAIAMYGATIGRLGILGVDAATNQACCLLTRPNHLDVKFTFYWLLVFKQNFIELYASGGGQPNINQEVIANLKIPAPGLLEQAQIARFLDHETARIDALIEEQQRLIELLKEKRQAVISHAVTKGLDPRVPMKDSGVEWLGEVPAHWYLCQVRHLMLEDTRNGLYKPEEEKDPDGVGFVQMGEAFRERVFIGGTKDKVQATEAEVLTWGLKEGDLLFSRRSLVLEGSGRCTRVGCLEGPYLFESSMIRVRLDVNKASPAYLHLMFDSLGMRAQVLATTKTVTISGIDSGQLKSLRLTIPPRKEQEEIADHLSVRLSAFDAAEQLAVETNQFLQERRSALISAAVTGKIDLRGWQPPADTPAPIREQETA